MTGNLTGGAGSIWVWASDLPHFKHSMQFAVMEGGSYTGLNVFRNARTDSDTDNPSGGNPKYLYGVSRGSNVHWNGTVNLSISKTITGDMADMTLEFPFTVTGVPAGQSCSYVLYTSQDGTTWQESGTSGELTADANGIISEESLKLGNYQKIVISVPYGSVVTVSEENGVYRASYVLDNEQVQDESRTVGITMNTDHTVAFINNLPVVAPTGFRTSIMPFILMMAFGLILIVGINLEKRKKKEELQ